MSNKSLPLNDKNAFMIVRNALIKSISQKAISNTNDIKNVSLCLNYIAKRLKIDTKPRLETIKEEDEIDDKSK